MKSIALPAITATLLILHLGLFSFTQISLKGYYTDGLLILSLFSALTLFTFLKRKYGNRQKWIFRSVLLFILVWIVGLISVQFRFPSYFDQFKIRKLNSLEVNGRLFHPYFKPTGAYGSGYGSIWISESPIILSIFEKQVYLQEGTHYDFGDENWDGNASNIEQVFRRIIQEEIIDKGF